MIVDADTSPRIFGVIDWGFSDIHGTSSSKNPHFHSRPSMIIMQCAREIFVIKRPLLLSSMGWGERRIQRAIFHSRMHLRGIKRLSVWAGHSISDLVLGTISSIICTHLWRWRVFDGVLLCLGHGILRKATQPFEAEIEVWKEVLNALGSGFVSNNVTRTKFRNHMDRFLKGGLVRDWLAATPELYLWPPSLRIDR